MWFGLMMSVRVSRVFVCLGEYMVVLVSMFVSGTRAFGWVCGRVGVGYASVYPCVCSMPTYHRGPDILCHSDWLSLRKGTSAALR